MDIDLDESLFDNKKKYVITPIKWNNTWVLDKYGCDSFRLLKVECKDYPDGQIYFYLYFESSVLVGWEKDYARFELSLNHLNAGYNRFFNFLQYAYDNVGLNSFNKSLREDKWYLNFYKSNGWIKVSSHDCLKKYSQ